jgi:hypothetical protein
MIPVWPSDLGKATMKSTEVDSHEKYMTIPGAVVIWTLHVGVILWVDPCHKSRHTHWSIPPFSASKNSMQWVPELSFFQSVLPLCCHICSRQSLIEVPPHPEFEDILWSKLILLGWCSLCLPVKCWGITDIDRLGVPSFECVDKTLNGIWLP